MKQRLFSSPLYVLWLQVLRGEPMVWTALAVFAACLVAWGGGLAFGGWLTVLADRGLYLLLILALLALRHQLSQVDPRERPFWNDLTGVYLAWLGQVILYSLDIAHTLRFYLVAECLLAAGYVAWILVLERQPHRRQRLRPKDLERALAWPAATLFVLGLLVYFVVIPMVHHRAEYLQFKSSMLLYLTLDLYVILRLLHQVQITRSRQWKAIYSVLTLTATCMLGADLMELLALDAAGWARFQLPFYGLQWLGIIIASRMRHHPLPGSDDREDPAGASLAAPSLHTMISAVSLPLIHFAGYYYEVLDRQTLMFRELAVCLWIVLLGGFALLQHWLLVDRARLLWVDWARADKALRRSEQKARVVTERLRARRALQASEERFAIAFNASPTPSAILSLTLGQFREVNAAFAQLVGYRKHQLIDQTPVALDIWWSYRDAVLFRRRIRGRSRLEDFTTQLRSAKGERLPVRLSAEILQVEAKACLLVVVHPGPGHALSAAPPNLEAADIAVFEVDSRDRISQWNPAAADLMGWQRQDVIDCYAGEVLAPRGDTTALVQRQRWRTNTGRRRSVLATSIGLPAGGDAAGDGRLVLATAAPARTQEPTRPAKTSSDEANETP